VSSVAEADAGAPAFLAAALEGDAAAVRSMVDDLTPVIQVRVARVLTRGRSYREARDVRQEVEDVTQEVFAALFAHDARVLRAWDAGRGLSFRNFVGLVATRHVASVLRSGKRNPWRDRPEELDQIERASEVVQDAEPALASRQALERLLLRLREVLSPRGLELFERLYVQEDAIEEVAQAMGMTREAIYAWRNRLGPILRQLSAEIGRGQVDRASDPGAEPRTPRGHDE